MQINNGITKVIVGYTRLFQWEGERIVFPHAESAHTAMMRHQLNLFIKEARGSKLIHLLYIISFYTYTLFYI